MRLVERGTSVDALTLSAVAEECEVQTSVTTIKYHFGNTDALVEATRGRIEEERR